MLDILEFFTIIGRALTFDSRVQPLVEASSWRNTLVTLIVVLAGLSEALGQSIVLFASRVKKRRFVFSLVFSALVYTFSFFFLSLCVWLVARFIFGLVVPFDVIVRTVGLGYAPYLFSFFILAPYFGNPISVILSLWSLLAINLGLTTVLGLGLSQTLLCTLLGWALVQLLQRTIGRPLVGGVRWLRRRVAGAPVVTSRAELRELFDLPQRPRAMLKFPKGSRRRP
jgi:hypothetical protein